MENKNNYFDLQKNLNFRANTIIKRSEEEENHEDVDAEVKNNIQKFRDFMEKVNKVITTSDVFNIEKEYIKILALIEAFIRSIEENKFTSIRKKYSENIRLINDFMNNFDTELKNMFVENLKWKRIYSSILMSIGILLFVGALASIAVIPFISLTLTLTSITMVLISLGLAGGALLFSTGLVKSDEDKNTKIKSFVSVLLFRGTEGAPLQPDPASDGFSLLSSKNNSNKQQRNDLSTIEMTEYATPQLD